MLTSIQISNTEFKNRGNILLESIHSQKLSGSVLFSSDYILYYTGFAFIPTERPVAFLQNSRGEKALFVPRMEYEHAQVRVTADVIDRVDYYLEYPYSPHPMEILKKTLTDMGMVEKFGVDNDGYPWIMGYRGPSMSELMGSQPQVLTTFIEDQMMIKSPAELALIRESVKWGNYAHTLLQRYTRPGKTETEVSLRASNEATLTMIDTIGPIYQALSPFSTGVSAGYRGQIGRNAAIPHALANNITFQTGDVLVSGAGAPVWGYNSELERTMIIGPATVKQKRMFASMLDLQEIALQALRPGQRCFDVDREVRSYYEAHNLMPYWKHHSGHAIGLRYHEGPFLDIGDETVLKPGMVFTVEPGLYVPEIGGFRHSDTVAVTEDGIEIMTYYPRDLANLTIPV
ncbi:MAG: M24 family metallopeptidase [Omnitrophica WOR_2 bacterium]